MNGDHSTPSTSYYTQLHRSPSNPPDTVMPLSELENGRPYLDSQSGEAPEGSSGAVIDPSVPLESQDWYWPISNRDFVNEAVQGKPQGTFVVRDSSTVPGDYALVLAVGSTVKLIKICRHPVKFTYGFSSADPIQFVSVPALVANYSVHSLGPYNKSLDKVFLVHPLSKSNLCGDQDSVKQLEQNLHSSHSECLHLYSTAEHLAKEHSKLQEELSLKHQALRAFDETLKLYEAQKNSHFVFVERSAIHERAKLQQNFSALCASICSLEKNKVQLQDVTEKLTDNLKLLEEQREECEAQLRLMSKTRQSCSAVLRTAGHGDLVDRVIAEVNERLRQRLAESTDCVGGCANGDGLRPCSPVYAPKGLIDYADLSFAENGQQDMLLDHAAVLSESRFWLGENLSKTDCLKLLAEKPDGSFFIRPSQSQPGYFALSIVCKGRIQQVLIECKVQRPGGHKVFGFADAGSYFASLEDLVQYYSENSLANHNADLTTRLLFPALYH